MSLATCAERARCWLAAPVAFLASCLALTGVISVPDVAGSVDELAAANERFAGWAAVGVSVCLGVSALALLAAPRVGAGPPLALGAAAAVFGLALGESVVNGLQVALAFVVTGAAVGGLLAGAACMALELPGRWRLAAAGGWALPLVAGWPVLTWLTLHDPPGDGVRLTLHPSVWPLAAVSSAIVAWGALSMLLEPPRASVRAAEPWESAWSALLLVAAVSVSTLMLLGFEPEAPARWVRPITMLVTGVLVAGMVASASLVPLSATRSAFVASALVAGCVPACAQLMLVVADAGDARFGAAGLTLVVACALLGSALGWVRPSLTSPALLVVAGAAAGAWAMPDSQLPMLAALAPLALGAAAAMLGAIRLSLVSPMSLRYVAMGVTTSMALGLVASVALGWALGGALAESPSDARSAGRVMLGLTFALAVVASAYTSTVRVRVPGETSREGGAAPS